MSEFIVRHDQGGVATLLINRPAKRNALCSSLFKELDQQVTALARETKRIGLVILRGAGGNFSSGYDMAEVLAYASSGTKPHYESDVIGRLANLPQPVISAVEGHCSTGALELALAADLIVASESARFSDVYARWGLTPVWGLTLRLPHRIGNAKAAEMMLTSRTYTGREAEAMHLANFCFPTDSFEAELQRLCADILANSWFANQVIKQALTETEGLPVRSAYARDLFKNDGLAPDAAKRISEFLDRRRQ